MKIRLFLTAVVLILCCSSCAVTSQSAQKKADKATLEWQYEIEGAGVGAQNAYMVRVWSYSKKKYIAIEQCKKNAVHGILFKGYAASANGRAGGQKPLLNASTEVEKADFFKDFFAEGGPYMRFVTCSSDDVTNLVKVGKRYKGSVVVNVNVRELRKYLESVGIMQSLSIGF